MARKPRKKARIVGTELYPYLKDKSGKPLCRFCQGKIDPPRYTFCSDECVHQYKIRTNREYARNLVFRRDRGVCQCCKLDTIWLFQQVLKRHRMVNYGRKKQRPFKARFEGIFKFRTRNPAAPYWEMDHKVPVASGGAKLGLENLQTLCLRCHYKKTAAHAKQRAGKKRQRPKKGR